MKTNPIRRRAAALLFAAIALAAVLAPPLPAHAVSDRSHLRLQPRDHVPTQGRYRQADPIGLVGGSNRHSYAGGNAISNFDPFGEWSTAAHNYFIQQFAAEVGLGGQYGFIERMQAGSYFADSMPFQGSEFSFMHAMSSNVWPPHLARKRMCEHVKVLLNAFHDAWGSNSSGKWAQAFFFLGMALHAIMDSTSPAHVGFQYWGGLGHAVGHGYGLNHGGWFNPFSKEDIDTAKLHRDKTVDLMKRAFRGDLTACGCD